MKPITLSRRLVSVALVAGLAVLGLSPVAAQAAGGPNLAIGKAVAASGALGAQPASAVNDGNANSYWESPNNAFPQWVQVDLGSSVAIDQVVLKLPPAAAWATRTETLSVQGSTDGSAFSTLSASAGRVFNPATGNAVTVDLTATTVRYVRVHITANTGWPAGQLSELEVYGVAGPVDPDPDPPTGTNLAGGKAIEASSATFNFVATNANDGNLASYWESAGFPATLTVKLGADANVTGVVVKLNPDQAWGTRQQAIQVLGRAGTATAFTELKPRADYGFNPSSNQNTVTIPVSGRASDVRLQIFTNSGAPGGQVAELQVIGAWAPAPDLVVTSTTWSPAAPDETSAIALTATVRNAGTVASAATKADFKLGGTVVAGADVPALAAGASATVTGTAGARAQGSYTVSTTVDPANTVAESNNDNNTFTASTPLVVGQAPGPDLQVTAITMTPANPAVGTAVSFTVAVQNRGISAAGASTTRLAVGTTTLTGATPAIAAGATTTVTIGGTWTAASGGATAVATADSAGVIAETNENNNTLSRSIVVGRGAAVPYTEYEAEAGRYQGTLLQADPLRTFGHTNFATESSGRQSVRLTSTGQFVEVTSTNQTNSIVVRNSVPDAAGGGGQDWTISLYVNDVFNRKLTLSSRNSWLYGTSDDTESLSNTPSADARRLFDESNLLLGQSYPAGTRFKLQRDSGDAASFYVIDLIDLEQVAAPLSQPAGCVSITTYGAVPNDGVDDTAAIQRAVTDDENGVISCVWIPAGQWRQEQKILSPDPTRNQYNQKGIRNAVIRGAGMWHTQLYTNTQPQNVVGNINHPHEGNVGFDIDDNTQISDLAIFGNTQNRANRGHGLNGRFGKNTKISNVWIEHVNVGAWVGRDYSDTPAYWNPGDGVEFTGMRIRDTFADGINFSNGTRNSRVFNSSFRTTGDDALAIWANPYVKDQSVDINHDDHFLNNTVQLPWRANGIAIYGGYGNSAENNLVYDTANYPGIMLATDHSPLPFSGTTLLANNGLYRTGGAFWNEDQEFGAITLFPSTKDITGVTIRDTDIIDSTFDGIQFKNGGGNMPNVAITNVRIDKSNNGAGILAMSGARGNAVLSGVTVTNSADGNIVTQPGSQFTFSGS
ncbi:CARDB domain-containing protein [Actinoplanes awajinensis]|uniref:APHP domain-containing protein n=1 Tax=Actinoplanes awajinensis subsp. mycoplanecinus TaxID=135947 RepID=A0A0X3UVV9_9ACTN|nr:CARDB domain-containing protein [Actinoplanes awajinensis]KUL36684.1 APHP domain-containing protein [Actinoplanes awajinensis subsp. mycoplanecinus]